MLGFIRSQPAIVERLLANITSPAVVDLLIRIIQCEDSADGQGVLGVRPPSLPRLPRLPRSTRARRN